MKSKFRMSGNNTCAECGKPIKHGDFVFARNMNEVVSGAGICPTCQGEEKEVEVKEIRVKKRKK